MTIDEKIKQLLELTYDESVYVEDYPHTNCLMYKINNPFTHFRKDIIVLCSVDEGIELAIDKAIEAIKKRHNEFFSKSYEI